MSRILVALSGGVDSSVAAALLKEAGFDVMGAHIVCWDACDLRESRLDALAVALKLDIPFVTLDLREEYKKSVFEYMVREYARGRTPNPDVMCNQEIKFGAFLRKALELGASAIATGHYVRRRSHNGEEGLLEGIDKQKDQSYFLWPLREWQLRQALFPLGEYTKARVREKARELGLPTAEKKDSQGLCFVGKVKFKFFLRDHLPRREGRVLTSKGVEVGRHDGVQFYTIGQRHGLGIGGGTPYYVAEKDPATNTLVVAEGVGDPLLYKKEILVEELNWLGRFREGRCQARVRYRQPKVPCMIRQENDRLRVSFETPQRAVSPGQSAVFYDGEKVLGGGIIAA